MSEFGIVIRGDCFYEPKLVGKARIGLARCGYAGNECSCDCYSREAAFMNPLASEKLQFESKTWMTEDNNRFEYSIFRYTRAIPNNCKMAQRNDPLREMKCFV
ncbi:hypothetical protein CEXT_542571 [Caerostris extrusa]|uniref:Uncharacterized protein n=1 Tax=Caerostris extrusa TaxID=172846 RepID=A0AAV4XZG0_CAEEX|nr:hypothetical protein CEXT_542571 [Caerostris extrusa]